MDNRLQEYNLIPIGINSKSIINLVCDIHGLYTIMAQSHYLNGNGCPLCRDRKPDGYWSLERCKKDALKYRTITEWQKTSSTAYNVARKNGWSVECHKHMLIKQKPSRYWTLERCIKEAKRYKTKQEWRIKSTSSYSIAKKNNWINKCSKHMVSGYKIYSKKRTIWNYKNCERDALKYKTKQEWRIKSDSAYQSAIKNKWIDKCCKHMISGRVSKWTKELLINDAFKYKSKKEWSVKSCGAYSAAHKRGWIKECCKHMINGRKK